MVYFDEIIRSRTLAHHGILGQKWGVRRFQNADGSLTEAGKKRNAKLYKKSGEANLLGTESNAVKSKAHSVRDAFMKWNKAEDELDDLMYKLLSDKTLKKKAIENAKKDGLSEKDPNFNYYVFGDTPSENYLQLAIYEHPDYKRAESASSKAYSDSSKAESEFVNTLVGDYGKIPLYKVSDLAKSITDKGSRVISHAE